MDRQKKVLIFVGAMISAGLLTWFLYANTVAPQTEKQLRVVVATHDMPLGTLLRQSDIHLVNYAERYVPKGVVLEPKEAIGRVLLMPLNNNEPVLLSKVSAPTNVEGIASTIEPGFRAVAVQINDATGVAGMIQPNARVDVLFTRPGTMAEAITSTILQNVKVLATGHQATTAQAAADTRTTHTPVVTLLLTPADAQKLELAKNEGKISLSLRNPLDGAAAAETGPVTTEVLDPNINARIALAKKGRVGGKNDLNDPRMWQELTGATKKEEPPKKEPEKPRVVVDAFHGDKHVQELFK
jgi:pilus assembly protein CpaB